MHRDGDGGASTNAHSAIVSLMRSKIRKLWPDTIER